MTYVNSSPVLFLCTGNYYRSRTAEALFNYYAPMHGLDLRADSRGLALSAGNRGPISPFAVDWLQARRVPFSERFPVAVSDQDLQRARFTVAVDETEHRKLIEPRFSAWADRVEYWTVHDIDRTVPDEALGAIDRNVQDLIERLKGT